MAFHISQEGARSRVPQADRVVIAAGRKKPAVPREGHGSDATAANRSQEISAYKKHLPVPVTVQR